jgi:hypothetical protein
VDKHKVLQVTWLQQAAAEQALLAVIQLEIQLRAMVVTELQVIHLGVSQQQQEKM